MYLIARIISRVVTSLFVSINDTVKATSITAFVTVTIFLVGRYFEQSKDRKLKINSEKIAVYKSRLQLADDEETKRILDHL
jgi:hypothetical protein